MSAEDPKPPHLSPKHFSMLRGFHLADLFTIANGFCGVSAIFEAMRFLSGHGSAHLYLAAGLIPVALVFDVLDGRVARWRHRASTMGRELDSLADVISFGVAPAAIAFAAGFNSVLDQIALGFFAVCGLSRLARYNVTAESLSGGTGKVKYFEGTPIPTSVVPLGIAMAVFYGGQLYPLQLPVIETPFHPVVLVFVLSGCLMISKTIHIPKP